MKFTDVTKFTTWFQLAMALLCPNKMEWSDCYITYCKCI